MKRFLAVFALLVSFLLLFVGGVLADGTVDGHTWDEKVDPDSYSIVPQAPVRPDFTVIYLGKVSLIIWTHPSDAKSQTGSKLGNYRVTIIRGK